jgi:hypothetical protein
LKISRLIRRDTEATLEYLKMKTGNTDDF